MPQTTTQPRTRCRLPCTVTLGRRRIHARVLDVSEGGLCIVTPVRFNQDSTVHIVIDMPRIGPVSVQGIVRHKRPFRQPSSGRRGWATGFALREAAPEFLAVAKPGAGLPEASHATALELLDPSARADDGALEPEPLDIGDSDVTQVFRVRLKAIGSTRTRTLTLNARSEEAVCEAVLTDLPGDWEIMGLEVNPLD